MDHAYGARRAGYLVDMLAVVVLLPIVIMILACSLERFEALTTRVAPPRAPRTPRPAAPDTTPAPRLALVRGLREDTDDTHDTEGPAAELRRAS